MLEWRKRIALRILTFSSKLEPDLETGSGQMSRLHNIFQVRVKLHLDPEIFNFTGL